MPPDLSQVNLLVVDGLVAPLRPTVPTMYIAPRRPPADVVEDGAHELPALTFQDPGSELLSDVDTVMVTFVGAPVGILTRHDLLAYLSN